jgi:hypothetical protein
VERMACRALGEDGVPAGHTFETVGQRSGLSQDFTVSYREHLL